MKTALRMQAAIEEVLIDKFSCFFGAVPIDDVIEAICLFLCQEVREDGKIEQQSLWIKMVEEALEKMREVQEIAKKEAKKRAKQEKIDKRKKELLEEMHNISEDEDDDDDDEDDE